jgi:methionyl aminopeptidase
MARADRGVPIRSADELVMARRAAQLAAEVLAMIEPHVVPGVTTDALDRLCHDHIVNVQGARPANVGYLGYPNTVLTSVNHVVCHGIPSPRQVLKKGDIVNIDVAVEKDGWYGDTSRWASTLGDVGHAIATVAQRENFSVVREYCGHGIGTVYHDEPQVLHYGRRGQGLRLEPGMIFTIEPMLNAGQRETKELADGWTVVTKDHSLSAQWEHMVAVTDSGFEVLTAWPGGTGSYPAV